MTLIRQAAQFCRIAAGVLAAAAVMVLQGCVTPQIQASTQVLALNLGPQDIKQSGLAFITPSSFTGQEEDKQALALSFHDVMQKARPDLRIVSLPMALTAVNRAGLAGEYRRMLEDYRLTGLLDRDVLRKVGEVTGSRYVAQLKLAGFRQESKDRWGTLGLRIFQTKSTVVRLFFQIWDSSDGSIAWEGSAELTLAHDAISEETVTFRSVIEESARRLVERMP
jgi:hypothetical protein